MGCSASSREWESATSVYDFDYIDNEGNEQSMERYRGHVLIIVNVASECRYTNSNYEQLDELYDKYSGALGLRILAFPSNEFGAQEPGTDGQIHDFVCTRYKAKYDFATKIKVNGTSAHPLWKYMKSKQGGCCSSTIKWNFTKFLIDKKGQVVKRFSPATDPREMELDVLKYFTKDVPIKERHNENDTNT